MSARLRVLRFAFVLLAWTLADRSAARAVSRFHTPEPGSVLASGTAVHVGWTLSAAESRGVDEMELVLSLDGGRTFPIRVTRDLEPSTLSLTWRVPALPATHARLALRAGHGEEPDAEQLKLVSEDFAIEVDPASPLEPALAVRGEWRTREALETGGSVAPLDPQSLHGQDAALCASLDLPDVAAPRPRSPAAACGTRPAAVFEAGLHRSVVSLRSVLPRTPDNTPRRE